MPRSDAQHQMQIQQQESHFSIRLFLRENHSDHHHRMRLEYDQIHRQTPILYVSNNQVIAQGLDLLRMELREVRDILLLYCRIRENLS